MPEISIETATPELPRPSESGEDARNIIDEYLSTDSKTSDKMMAAVALALLDVADAIRNS
jgi:hypothetical protein